MTPPPDVADFDMTRASLILRIRQGGEAREVAWQEFFDRYAPMIAAFARRLGATRDEAEELVSDVMRAFFRRAPEFEYDPARGRFRGYLQTCACNKLKRLRERARPAGDIHALLDAVAVEATWNDVWETDKLRRAVAMTRERYSTNAERIRTFRAFEMVTLLERPTAEVAAELGLTEDNVRQAKSRVSKAIRQAFDHLDEMTG